MMNRLLQSFAATRTTSILTLAAALFSLAPARAAAFLPDDPPVAVCQDITMAANDSCFAIVLPGDIDNGSYDPDADSLIFSISPEGPFAPGIHEVTLTVTDTTGLSDQCTATVEVKDTLAPQLTVTDEIMVLWPPNHAYEVFHVSDFVESVWDNCPVDEEDVRFVYATSDEPENSTGDGNTEDDILIGDNCSTISLRKERKGNSNGRVYTLYLLLEDDAGNADSATCHVHVPHNPGSTPVDDGVAYEVEGDCSPVSAVDDGTLYDGDPLIFKSYPNPFTGVLHLEFTLPYADRVEVRLYDLQGNLVHTFIKGNLPAGDHAFDWNGQGPDGQPAGNGIFLLRILTSDHAATSRIVKF